jgi:predicted nucleotidyltransferase component of viral defense system
MIGREEIENKSAEYDIHIANVERDYVFGWLLKGIFENDYLRQELVFKGGNCLRKGYYPETRFSSDLDFSAPQEIDLERMAHEINNACIEAGRACGVKFLIDRNTFMPGPRIDRERQSYKGSVYFTDFFGKADNLTISVKIDVTEFDRLYLPAVTRQLIHPYSDAGACSTELRCMALEEIVANKMKCLIQRRHSHDLFDLVYAAFINRSIALDRGLVLRTFFGKTIFGASPGAAKEILLGIPMTFFGGVWEKFIRCPKPTRFGFDQAAEGFRQAIESLFEGIQTVTWGARAFFPSEQRNLILEAGAERKLLRVTYDGVERIVEPYALSYKRPKSGQPQEYFYVWDQTGGRKSGPGIKSLVNTGLSRIESTGETFEPRYEIELSKAGEEARKGYFGKPFSDNVLGRLTRQGIARPRTFRAFAQAYKIECPYCQKRFTRSTVSLELNPHKDSNGYPCRSRRGYRV